MGDIWDFFSKVPENMGGIWEKTGKNRHVQQNKCWTKKCNNYFEIKRVANFIGSMGNLTVPKELAEITFITQK